MDRSRTHTSDPEALARFPPEERADWNRFWNELPKPEAKEVGPPPGP